MQKDVFHQLALEFSEINFTFTGNQNLIIGPIDITDKVKISNIIQAYENQYTATPLRKNSMSCVALPTCPLALAEAQRYLPLLITKMEALLAQYGLSEEDVVTRMTGCPNGCGRPYVAEIGFVGTGPGQYNMMLGGDRFGERLNKIYKEKLNENEILHELDHLLQRYVVERNHNETFGDFCNRKVLA